MSKPKIYSMAFATVYPCYIAKAERKGRSQAEVDAIITWLTGYDADGLREQLLQETSFECFFENAPRLNPVRERITGVVCGVRIESIEEGTMREIRYLDKLVDELARGKAMDKILRD